MSEILDATGKGFGARVDSKNRLRVYATSEEFEVAINRQDGRFYSLPMDALVPGGANYFMYVRNDEPERNLHVTFIRISSSVAGVYRVELVTGTPAGGTNVAPTGMNTSDGTVLAGTAANMAAGSASVLSGANITGLTTAGLVTPLTTLVSTQLDTPVIGHVILGPGKALALKAPGAATVNGVIRVAAVPIQDDEQ